MNACETIRRLHRHRRWVNQKLLEATKDLTEEQLRRSFAIGQGSIWKTLVHLMAAEYVWLEAVRGNEDPLMPGDVAGKLPGNQEGDEAIQSWEELAERWETLEAKWRETLSSLTEESLDRLISKKSTSSGAGKIHATRCGDLLLHVCTHAQYTTAQLINMLKQLGVRDLPDVMLISMAREEY